MYISEKLQIFICDFPKLKSKCFSSQIILALGKQTNKILNLLCQIMKRVFISLARDILAWYPFSLK